MNITDLLTHAWNRPFKTKSDFARKYATETAKAASDGMITTKCATGYYGDRWRVTVAGLQHLHMMRGEDT